MGHDTAQIGLLIFTPRLNQAAFGFDGNFFFFFKPGGFSATRFTNRQMYLFRFQNRLGGVSIQGMYHILYFSQNIRLTDDLELATTVIDFHTKSTFHHPDMFIQMTT